MSIVARLVCPCGRRLHYPTSHAQAYLLREIRRFGPTVPVSTTQGVWLVPRHYYVLHGSFRPWEIGELAAHFGWRRVSRHPRPQHAAA